MSVCPICQGIGLMPVMNAESGEEELTPCTCSKAKIEASLKLKRYENAHIPKGLLHIESEDFYSMVDSLEFITTGSVTKPQADRTNEKSKLFIQSIVDDPEGYADNGPGVAWIYNLNSNFRFDILTTVLTKAYSDKSIRIRFFKINDLLKQLLNYKDVEKYEELEMVIKTYKVFIIENMFFQHMVGGNNSYVLSSLYHFIDTAISNGIKIICTSDKKLDKIPEDYTGISTLFQYSLKEIQFIGGVVKHDTK
jgi:hypothetical protein